MRRIRFATLQVSLFLILLGTGIAASAQDDRTGTWNVLNLQYQYNPKWSVFFEGQLRSQKLFNDHFYHEMKAGINYNITEKVAFLVGSGQYQTYSIGGNFKSPMVNSEHRVWQQLQLDQDISRLQIEHRFRVEQRWQTEGFANRFRYRLNTMLPLNKAKLEKGSVFVTGFEELFFTDKLPHFLRSRFFAGVGYQFSSLFTLQSGFLRQADYTGTEVNSKSFIQTTLQFKFKRQKPGVQQFAGILD